MGNPDDLAEWIQQLSSAEPKERFKSAARLYQRGRKGVDPIFAEWRQDRDFAKLMRNSLASLVTQHRYPLGTVVVGVAVQPERFDQILEANGSPPLAQTPDDQDAKEFELLFGEFYALDILTTRDPNGNGAIAKFLRKFGEGIQQVELYVRDVDRATEILQRRFGVPPIYPATRTGANGTRVNFFLVSSSGGGKLLLELVEDKKP